MSDMINLCNRLIETSEEILLNYKSNDNISLIEKQANALEEKDKYISELEEKLKNYELSSTKNISVDIKEQIIGFSPTKSNEPKPPEPEPLKLQSDIKYKKVKHEKVRYYVISGESPQTLYKIREDGECGEKCGKRIKKGKGYEYQLDP